MIETKGKGGNKPGANPAPDPVNPGSTVSAKRTRSALSPQKQFAIAIAGLVALLNQRKLASLLTEPEKAQVKAADNMAKELNAKTIKPLQDRIKAIQGEFKTLAEKITEPGTAEQAKELSIELGRKQKRLRDLTSATAPAA